MKEASDSYVVDTSKLHDVGRFVRLRNASLRLQGNDTLEVADAKLAGDFIAAALRGEDVRLFMYPKRGRGKPPDPQRQFIAMHYGLLKTQGAEAAAMEVGNKWNLDSRSVTKAAAEFPDMCTAAEEASGSQPDKARWLAFVDLERQKYMRPDLADPT